MFRPLSTYKSFSDSFFNDILAPFFMEPIKVFHPIKVDIEENEKEFLVYADLPGVQKEDIQVDFKEGLLTISVEKEQSHEKKDGARFLRIERNFEKKSRSFYFETAINEEGISARYENGVLTLTLPKKNVGPQSKKIVIS